MCMKSEGEIEIPQKNDDGHAGVLILTKKDMIVDSEETLEADCVLLQCYVQIKGRKKLNAGA